MSHSYQIVSTDSEMEIQGFNSQFHIFFSRLSAEYFLGLANSSIKIVFQQLPRAQVDIFVQLVLYWQFTNIYIYHHERIQKTANIASCVSAILFKYPPQTCLKGIWGNLCELCF